MIGRLIFAAVCGAGIGFERERRDRPAGFRTFILVATGSALFGIVSIFGYPATGPGISDTGRVAAQVVTGIGFLGAGALIRGERSVRGMTTAASIWAVAAIGLAAGAGLYLITLVGTTVIVITLAALRRLERDWTPRVPPPPLERSAGPTEVSGPSVIRPPRSKSENKLRAVRRRRSRD